MRMLRGGKLGCDKSQSLFFLRLFRIIYTAYLLLYYLLITDYCSPNVLLVKKIICNINIFN